VWAHFEKSKRRQTRKGEREGIEVSAATTSDEIAEYYEIYKRRIAQWNQRNSYPKSLFAELVSRGGERVRLFVARANGKMLGGHLNFYFKDTVIAWNGVTTLDRLSPQASTLLYSTCLRDACERNYKAYNLGGSLDKESLIDYKQALGGVPHSYTVYRWRSKRARIAAALRRSLRPSGE